MAFLTKIEAAIALGVSVELLESFVKKCPKPKGDRTLSVTNIEGKQFFSEDELHSFNKYLNESWPLPPSGKRPHIPSQIKEDIKQESHYGCAICGFMDNGEVAHIEAVAKTLNNSPANLIFLCPNHHTKYDLGYKPASNVTTEVIKAAKLVKRNSRVRMLRVEADVTKTLLSIINLLSILEGKLKSTDASSMTAAVYLTEAKNLLGTLSTLTNDVKSAASKDTDTDKLEKLLDEKTPTLKKLASVNFKDNSDASVRTAVVGVVNVTRDVLIEIDEVECPHCGGTGTKGWVGDFCVYCHGVQVVSTTKSESYDPEGIDEIDCPHCAGRGQTGMAGDLCSYCGGSCVVSQEKHDAYDREEIDEVDCPHCAGSGQTGWNSDVCVYCGGSCVVSQEKHDAYDRDEIDEVDCPHCAGRGQTGWNSAVCIYCGGSCVVSQEKHDAYDRDEIDEVECPHCSGRGQTGMAGDLCALCKGECVVKNVTRDAYFEKYGR